MIYSEARFCNVHHIVLACFIILLDRTLIRCIRYLTNHSSSPTSLSSSQFYVTFKATPHLDNKHTVFGKLVGGEDVLDALENLPRKDGTERPSRTVRIVEVVM